MVASERQTQSFGYVVHRWLMPHQRQLQYLRVTLNLMLELTNGIDAQYLIQFSCIPLVKIAVRDVV